jgi:hypothetical protein
MEKLLGEREAGPTYTATAGHTIGIEPLRSEATRGDLQQE